jgi:hypothetical protein
MKLWPLFVVCTVLCWGAYVPMIHHGQLGFGTKNSALRAFLFVGAAYFLIAGLTLAYLVLTKAEPLQLTRPGVTLSTIAGVLGALGALGIVFAIKSGGAPLTVAPLVFGGAPVVNTVVSMLWDRPAKPPSAMFYVGIVLAGAGAAIVLRFKPA